MTPTRAPAAADYDTGRSHGLRFNIMGDQDAPGAVSYPRDGRRARPDGEPLCGQLVLPGADHCAAAYVAAANGYRAKDPQRPVWGNFTKDVDEWSFPPAGWSGAAFRGHVSTMLRSLDIASADDYGWTDTYEYNQSTGEGTGHDGAWVYGHAVARLQELNPRIPAYGFVECCDSTDGNGATKPTNEMMPGMLQAAVWNILVHGGRGYVYWTTNFWDSSPGGDPDADPYPGATYTGNYALYSEHQWDAQFAAARAVNLQVRSLASALNAPTILGISASGASGCRWRRWARTSGASWLLAEADGDAAHPLQHLSMIARITVPDAVAPGTELEVLGEHRTVTVDAHHQITDTFATTSETPFSGRAITYGYQHHIYVMR